MSKYKLGFDTLLDYSKSKQGIDIGVVLTTGEQRIVAGAKLDTGSTYCIFQPQYAALLGLSVEDGEPERIRTGTGQFYAFGHRMTIGIESFEWDATVYFVKEPGFPISVVGRIGFLDRLSVGLIDYYQQLYIGPINNEEV